MILSTDDFYTTEKFYRIPTPAGASDTKDLTGVIDLAESQFRAEFDYKDSDVLTDVEKEALKFYTFYKWLIYQATRKTSSGAGQYVEFSAAQNKSDIVRRVGAYNQCCELLCRKDKKMFPMIHY